MKVYTVWFFVCLVVSTAQVTVYCCTSNAVGSGLARNTDRCAVWSCGPILAGNEIDCQRVQS
jgi:hypothetical protein